MTRHRRGSCTYDDTSMRALAELLVGNLVELVMFSVGLRTRPRQVLAILRDPTFLLRELLVVAVGIPLVTLLVVLVLPLPPWTTVVAILFAISPAAPSLLAGFRREDAVATKALAAVTVALAASTLVVPIWLALVNRLFGYALQVSPQDIFVMLALKVFAPLLAGMLLRHVAPRFARRLEPVVSIAAAIAFVLVVVLLIYLGAASMRLVTATVLVGLVLIAIGSAVVGEVAGGRDLELRVILGRVALTGNPAIVLAIIATSYPDLDLDLGGLVAAFIIARAVAAIPYTLLANARISRARPGPCSPDDREASSSQLGHPLSERARLRRHES